MSMGTIHQINVKGEKPTERGLPKSPVESVFVTRRGLEGDFNRFRHEELSDDPDSAVLLITLETLEQLQKEGWPVRPGDLGENFTTHGTPSQEFFAGETFRVGGSILQLSRPCDPCINLYGLPYVGQAAGPRFLKVMLGRRGWYARVLTPGQVRMGDPVEKVPNVTGTSNATT